MASRTMGSGRQLLFPIIAIVSLVSGRVNAQVTCQTSGASPNAGDAKACSDYLINLGNTNCCQNDCSGPNACTTMVRIGTAASDICGNCGQCVPCQQAGNYVLSIVGQCDSVTDGNTWMNGQVGGYTYGFTNPTVNVNVYHT